MTDSNQVNPSNTSPDAITSSLVVQIDYACGERWQQTRPLFALPLAPSFPEANALAPLLRNLVDSARLIRALPHIHNGIVLV